MQAISVWVLEDSSVWLGRLLAQLALRLPTARVRTFDNRPAIEAAWQAARGNGGLPDALIIDLFVPNWRWQRRLIDFGERHPRLANWLVRMLPHFASRELRFRASFWSKRNSWWGGVEFLNSLVHDLRRYGPRQMPVFLYTLCANDRWSEEYPALEEMGGVAFAHVRWIRDLNLKIYAKGRLARGEVLPAEDSFPKLVSDLRRRFLPPCREGSQ